MSEYEFTTKQSGWVCPVCGRVFAPWVPECTYHNPGLTNMYPQENTETPIRDFMTKPTMSTPSKPLTGDGDYYKHLTGNAK